MRIVQTVFGAFWHFDLARQLQARGHLESVFSTWPRARLHREGISPAKLKTFPWIHTPEYLLRKYGLLPRALDDAMGYANALTFDEYTLRTLPECDALIAISGSSLKTGRLLQSRGGVFLCDRGSSHQRYQETIIAEEYRRWCFDEPVSDPRDTAREEQIYAEADGIVVPSLFAARSFLEMGVPAEKVHTIPFGVELKDFAPTLHPPDDAFEVLFVGGVNLRKGIPYLLEAFALLKHPKKRLRIVGGVGRGMEEILRRLPQDGIEILGPVKQSLLADIMSSSHVMVLPSIEDGFGLVIGQAMASGCPVIASENTGGPDIITDGVDGFVVPIRDVSILTERMQRLADEPTLQTSMRVAGIARVKQLGGCGTYGARWEELLSKLIAND